MSKLYPTTNTIVEGNDIQVEMLNQEVRECFEVSNGGLDQYNIEAGSSTCGAGGIEASKFVQRSWNNLIIGSGGENTSITYAKQVILPNSLSVTQHQFASRAHTNVQAGLVSGQCQIRYWVNSLQFLEAAEMGFAREQNDIDPTVDFSIYVNGAKVGETDVVSRASGGTINMPFFFYHPGGDLQVDLYAGANGGETLMTMNLYEFGVPGDGEVGNFRLRIQNYLYIANVRVR